MTRALAWNRSGTAPIGSDGVATLVTSDLTAGAHSITAAYSGHPTNQPSASDAMSQFVKLVSTVTSMSVSLLPAVYGQSVSFTAHVAQHRKNRRPRSPRSPLHRHRTGSPP